MSACARTALCRLGRPASAVAHAASPRSGTFAYWFEGTFSAATTTHRQPYSSSVSSAAKPSVEDEVTKAPPSRDSGRSDLSRPAGTPRTGAHDARGNNSGKRRGEARGEVGGSPAKKDAATAKARATALVVKRGEYAVAVQAPPPTAVSVPQPVAHDLAEGGDSLLDSIRASFNRRISRAKRKGDTKAALEVFADMRSAGVSPDKITFSALIGAAAERGDGEMAFSIFDDMVRRGIPPTERTVTSLLEACARNRERPMVEEAVRLFGECTEVHGVTPDAPLMNAFLKVLASRGAGGAEMAFRIMEEGAALGVPDFPNHTSYMMVAATCVDREHRRRLVATFPSSPTENETAVWAALLKAAVVHAVYGVKRATRAAVIAKEKSDADTDYWRLGEEGEAAMASGATTQQDEDGTDDDAEVKKDADDSPTDGRGGDSTPPEFVSAQDNPYERVASLRFEDGVPLHTQGHERFLPPPLTPSATLNRVGPFGLSAGAEPAAEVLAEMRARGIAPPSEAWLTALQYNAVLAKDVEAQMASDQTVPEAGLYVALIRAYGRQEGSRAVVSALSRVLAARALAWKGNGRIDAILCGAALAACADVADMAAADVVLGMAAEKGIALSAGAYNACLKVAARAGSGKRAIDLYENMRKAGLPVSVLTYTSLFSACANNARGVLVRAAATARDDMVRAGIIPDAICLSAYVSVFVNAGDADGALAAFGDAECFAADGFPTPSAVSGMRRVCQTIEHRHRLGQLLVAFRSASRWGRATG